MPEYLDIQITNFQLHTATPQNPRSVGRVIERSIRSKKEQRAYTTDMQKTGDNGFQFVFHNPELERIVAKAKAEGKIVRFYMPKGGIPVFLGKDAHEFLGSNRWKEYLAKEGSPQSF